MREGESRIEQVIGQLKEKLMKMNGVAGVSSNLILKPNIKVYLENDSPALRERVLRILRTKIDGFVEIEVTVTGVVKSI